MEDMCSTMRGILKIIWFVLPSCFVTPLTWPIASLNASGKDVDKPDEILP